VFFSKKLSSILYWDQYWSNWFECDLLIHATHND
jgi:hypothetical protein